MRSLAFGLLGLCAALAGCSNEGTAPPLGRLYFPTALGISGNHLIVANSNFDLRYNRGSLQSYDLERLAAVLEEHCGSRSQEDRDRCGVLPEEDPRADLSGAVDLRRYSGLLTSEVIIGSYANGLALQPSGDGSRIYLPVRSDANLTFVDVDASGCLECGGGESSCNLNEDIRHECSDAFRRGDDESANARGIELPADPVAVAAGPVSDLTTSPTASGSYVLMAHRGGRVSLFLDDIAGGDVAPKLVHTLEGLPTELVTLTVDPVSRSAWIPNANEPVLSRVGVALDEDLGALDQSFLFNAGNIRLAGIDTGSATRGDTRIIRFDPREDVRRAYVLSRRPRALLTIDVDDSFRTAEITNIVGVGNGPSRLQVERFEDEDRTLAFISCFDSRDLYVIDLDAGRLVGIVRGLGGPFELAVDTDSNRLYVADFAQSVIRVLDLDPMFECLGDTGFEPQTTECSPAALGFIGRPRPIEELI